MGTRVPADGQGFQTSPIATEAHVAGLYEQYLDTTGLAAPPGVTALDVALPQWTGLAFNDGTAAWSPSSGTLLGYRQTLDMLDGVLTTSARWRSPSGRVTQIQYELVVDRARLHIGLVRLTVTPEWTGTASIEDVLGPGGAVEVEGSQAQQLNVVSAGADPATATNRYMARTPSGYATMAETSRLAWDSAVAPSAVQATSGSQLSGLTVTFPVHAGQSYVFAKVVGVATSVDSTDPSMVADAQSAQASAVGADGLIGESSQAWRQLWSSRIDVAGEPTLGQEVHASQFYLLESFDKDVTWSTSPGGLSSGGYNGHIFWDADTWMYPSLLIGHPDIAAAADAYRDKLLPAAQKYAAATGYAGARFPWESAASGGEEAPPPFGTLEQHISSDVALAQWQYYLATGDRAWLAQNGWPVISQVADFWASRAVPTPQGYEILAVMPPDEYDFPVNDSAYTNAGAITTLRAAIQAAAVLGKAAPAQWAQVADGLVVPFDASQGIHPEYDGYNGKQIKQADTVMLTYPWEYPMSAKVAAADLNYYIPRTDPEGPSMTDSIHAIDYLALDLPGCASYTLMRRSLDPFIRKPFDQFSETRSGGTFTFLTGTGGFLQSFYYGFSGFRWRADRIHLDPALPPEMRGVTLRDLHWQGRTFTVEIGPDHALVTLVAGPPARIEAPGIDRVLGTRATLTLATRRPDLQPTDDLARCKPISASGTAPGEFAFAADDGSADTSWVGATQTDSLTVDLTRRYSVHSVTVTWGVSQPVVNTQNAAGSVSAPARASAYHIDVSSDGLSWRRAAEVSGEVGTEDQVSFAALAARYVRLVSEATASGGPPSVAELAVQGSGGGTAVGTPSPNRATCSSHRTLVIHLRRPRGARILALAVTVNGRRLRVRPRRRGPVRIDLRGRHAATVTVVIRLRVRRAGRTRVLTERRTFHTCARARRHRRRR